MRQKFYIIVLHLLRLMLCCAHCTMYRCDTCLGNVAFFLLNDLFKKIFKFKNVKNFQVYSSIE